MAAFSEAPLITRGFWKRAALGSKWDKAEQARPWRPERDDSYTNHLKQ
jgi:hypothetical protein